MLVEWWHKETSSLHLLTGEAMVTLEDVWKILRFPTHGEHMIYDVDVGREACYEIMAHDEIVFCEG